MDCSDNSISLRFSYTIAVTFPVRFTSFGYVFHVFASDFTLFQTTFFSTNLACSRKNNKIRLININILYFLVKML